MDAHQPVVKERKPSEEKEDDLAPFLKRFEEAARDQVVALGNEGWVRRSFKFGRGYVSRYQSTIEMIYQTRKGNTEVFQSLPCKTEEEARKAPLSTLPVEYMSFRVFLASKNGRLVPESLKKVYPVSCENVNHVDLSPLDPIHSIWTALQKVSEQ